MNCCPKSQAGSKPAAASSKINSRKSRPNSDKRLRPASKPTNRLRLLMFSNDLIPENSNAYSRSLSRCLPAPIVERNPTLSNPFVRIKVYELACGEP